MNYFSIIDLKDGFFQIPIEVTDREKTTFKVGSKLMQFTKMPQGFKNSPAIFQRGMNIILEDLLEEKCLSYIDDILIFGKTKEEHNANFKEIQKRLLKYGLTENIEKRVYCQNRLTFLGYEISKNRIRPTNTRKEGIINYRSPKTKRELQRFLGLINYDRLFIKNITEKIKPLYKLLEKEIKFKWTEVEEETFQNIKKEWKNSLELYVPDMKGEFTLESDASDVGLGAVLTQNEIPVAFISRSLSSCERNYSITEREFLAALWAMEKLKYYLEGRIFTLITDHKPL